MRREDRASISSHPLADLGWKLLRGLRHRLLLISRSSFVRAKGRSFVPARRTSVASRAAAVTDPRSLTDIRPAPRLDTATFASTGNRRVLLRHLPASQRLAK